MKRINPGITPSMGHSYGIHPDSWPLPSPGSPVAPCGPPGVITSSMPDGIGFKSLLKFQAKIKDVFKFLLVKDYSKGKDNDEDETWFG